MWVVRRNFRTGGVFYRTGSIIVDPSSIKRFKIKLTERKVLKIPTEPLQRIQMIEFYQGKFSIDLQKAIDEAPQIPVAAVQKIELPVEQVPDVNLSNGTQSPEELAEIFAKQFESEYTESEATEVPEEEEIDLAKVVENLEAVDLTEGTEKMPASIAGDPVPSVAFEP